MKRLIYSLLITTISLIAITLTDNYYRGEVEQANTRALQDAVEDIRRELSQNIDARITVAKDLRAFMLTPASLPDYETFDRFSTLLLDHYPQVLAVQFVDPSLVIRHIFPLTGNESALNLDLTTRPAAPFVEKAVQERRMTVNHPTMTVQGSLSVIPRVPLYQGNEFLGLVQVVIEIEPVLRDATKYLDGRLHFQLKDATGALFWGPEILNGETASATIPVGDNFWTLTVGWQTSSPAPDPFVRMLIWGGGGLLLLSMLFIGNQAWNRTEWLKQEVAKRTEELETEITRRNHAEGELLEANLSLEHILSASPLPILGTNPNGCITRWNNAAEQLFGWGESEAVGNICPTVPSEEMQDYLEMIQRTMQGEISISQVRYRQKKDGARLLCNVSAAPQINEHGKTVGATLILEDVTERKQAEEEIRANTLLLQTIGDNFPHSYLSVINKDLTVGFTTGQEFKIRDLDPNHFFGLHINDVFGEYGDEVLNTITEKYLKTFEGIQQSFELFLTGEYQSYDTVPLADSDGNIDQILVVVQNITERKQMEESLESREKYFRALIENNIDAIAVISDSGKVLYQSPASFKILGFSAKELTDENIFEFVHPEDQAKSLGLFTQLVENPGKPVSGEIRFQNKDGAWRWVEAIGTNLLTDSNVQGIVVNFRDITDRKQAEEQIQRQLNRLNALRLIDMAISSSFDLHVVLNIVLQQVLSQLGVDASAVLLLNPYTQTIEYAGGRGFRSDAIQHTRLKLGEEYAGRVVLERQTIHISDLKNTGGKLAEAMLSASENFTDYLGTPLVVKGEVKGVLEIFHRTPLEPDKDWLNFMEVLARQAAIAIDNAQLFENMQHSNMELIAAYDATIVGWSHAMDLRDKETQDHTKRVTELTLKMAERMRISKQEQVHIQRGALLHDIGKLGIPDHILHKPGKLTKEEWDIMRQHPIYAFEMLSAINYLRPALDIPYCHHEKWDGSGYPRGLRGEQIPLAARIFAIVDAWDALTSDRPYREAWTKEKALKYIQEQSGVNFDPNVVEVFLELTPSEGINSTHSTSSLAKDDI